MKRVICLLFAGCLCLGAFAKDDEPEGKINSVNTMSSENKKGEDVEILKINSIQSGGEFEGVMRIAMQLEDKNDKVAWGKIDAKQPVGKVRSGEYEGLKATGAVTWTCETGNNTMKRPKLAAYAVEYGYMKGGEFVVLDAEYKKTDSFDEFEAENKESIPLKLRVKTLSTVDE
jgi:hypothetical protein